MKDPYIAISLDFPFGYKLQIRIRVVKDIQYRLNFAVLYG